MSIDVRSALRERLKALIPKGEGKAIADLAGITAETLSRLLQGKETNPRLDTLIGLASALDMPLHELLWDETCSETEASAFDVRKLTRDSLARDPGVTNALVNVPLYREVHPEGFHMSTPVSHGGFVMYQLTDDGVGGFSPGDTFLVDPEAQQPHTGVFVVASVHGKPGGMFRVEKDDGDYVLSKDRPGEPPVRENWRILGTVIGVWSSLPPDRRKM